MVTRHPGVVLVDFAEALFPVVELAGADAEPGKEAADGNLRLDEQPLAPSIKPVFVDGAVRHEESWGSDREGRSAR